jgi:hypothetical protein
MKPTQTAFARAQLGLEGVGAAGAVVSMREAYPRAPQAAPAEGWLPATPVPEGRLAVAVVLGASGSVITDALGPYEGFARSPTFFVYTVSASHPTAMPSGGLAVCPTTRWKTSRRAWRRNRTWSWSRPWLGQTARRKHRCASRALGAWSAAAPRWTGSAASAMSKTAPSPTGPAWLLVAGLAGHGFKDLWQDQSHYVANTRWWPPFCLVVDWVAAAILVVLIAAGVDFHH